MFKYQWVWQFEYGRISSGIVFGYLSACDFKPLSSDWLTISWGCIIITPCTPPPPPTQPPPLPISWKRTLGILWSPLSIHSSVCSWCHLFLLCCMNFDQICCKPFPFARLLQPHVDFWSWAKDQKVKCVNFCPLLCVLQHCAQDLKGSCCLPSCMLKLYNIQSAFYSDLSERLPSHLFIHLSFLSECLEHRK